MTSNAGTSVGSNNMGFSTVENQKIDGKIEKALKEIFRPEFLNRIDAIIEFKELTKDELKQIISLMLKDLVSELEHMGIAFEITDSAKDLILKNSYNPKFGARPIRREIQNSIEDKIAEFILTETDYQSKKITVDAKDGKYDIKMN